VTLHLVKLCVGASTPEDLAAWRAQRAAEGRRAVVHTRQTPRRAAELLAGGSLFWVFKGVILVRQPIAGVETVGEGALRRCEILLGERMIRTAPHPRRAFQGWRYLDAADAPADLDAIAEGDVPDELARRLRDAGAW